MRSPLLAPAVVAVALAPAASAAPPDGDLHRRAVVIDTHADTTQMLTYGGADISRAQPDLNLDLPKAAAGGLDAEFFSIFVFPKRFKQAEFFTEAQHQIDAIEKLANEHPQQLRVARTSADVRANAAAGVFSVLLGLEGGHALWPGDEKTQLAHLHALAERGVRYMTLTWSISNDLGGSSGDTGDIRGLTAFGRQVIEEMNRLGVIVDLSHVSDATFWDAIRATTRPVLATHSSARTLTNIPRNMTDAMLKAVAANGGAVCVNFGAAFLDLPFSEQEHHIWSKGGTGPPLEVWRRLRAEADKINPRVPLARLVDHIQHVAKIAGVEHTCLGSDFDGVPALPAGMESVDKLPALTAALRARGFAGADVEKILGGNVLRVMQANEGAAVTPRR